MMVAWHGVRGLEAEKSGSRKIPKAERMGIRVLLVEIPLPHSWCHLQVQSCSVVWHNFAFPQSFAHPAPGEDE